MAELNIPTLQMPQSKLDKLGDDLQKLELGTAAKSGGVAIPVFQRHGYLEKLGHTRQKWFKRFFVLRDSFLLAYNLQKSDYTVEPRAAIHLGGSTIQTMDHAGKDFCIMITTTQRDKFVLAAENKTEQDAWVHDLEISRKVTHANMIKLAVENKCLAETKGAMDVVLDNSTSALAIFSNEQYIQSTPITGGAEGWLRTTGFNPEEVRKEQSQGIMGALKGKKIPLQKLYFMLRDSHLLMFNGGDMLTKPRGVMYLLSTVLDMDPSNDSEGEFHFKVRSPDFGDEIDLVASSNKVRKRWVEALRVGSRVSFPDFTLLNKEHALLASVSMTPRAAPVQKANDPAPAAPEPTAPMMFEDFDIQGEQLDPGTQQAYDDKGQPVLRDPSGNLVTLDGDQLAPSTPRFNATGEQLDPFNRALPPGAVPMFLEDGTPIGVGPDGQHYLPDGSVVEPNVPHYDADGNPLNEDTVQAADAVATNLQVAIKVRGKLKGEDTKPEAVDALGRTFRAMNAEGGDTITNADGQEVPLASARMISNESGGLVEYSAAVEDPNREETLQIKAYDDQGDEKALGSVTVNAKTTLKEVRSLIHTDLSTNFEDFVFLVKDIPLLKYEESDKLAFGVLPEIFVRGGELKAVKPQVFTAKVEKLAKYEEEKKKEENEFNDVMAKIRQGKFLRSTRQSAFLDA